MKGTKMAALFVLALFVVSIVPFVAAEDNGAADGNVTAEQVSAQKSAYDKSREDLKARTDQMREQLKQQREQLGNATKEMRGQIRQQREQMRNETVGIRQEVKQEHKELNQDRKALFQQWKDKRGELKQEREQARTDLNTAKDQLKGCKGSDSANCQDQRKNAKVQAGKFLSVASEHIIALVEKSKDRIQTSNLADADKTTLIATLDADLNDIDAAQQAASALGENATVQQLKDSAQQVKQLWGKIKTDIKDAMSAIVGNRVGGIEVKMEQLAARFDKAIADLEAKGKDVTAAKAKQADFKAKLDSAKALQEQAKTLVASGDRAGANEKLQAAHSELKAANDLLRGLVQEIRGMGGDKELESAGSNETSTGAAA